MLVFPSLDRRRGVPLLARLARPRPSAILLGWRRCVLQTGDGVNNIVRTNRGSDGRNGRSEGRQAKKS
jgi:hypothetical protein